jgi:hypothetical protein
MKLFDLYLHSCSNELNTEKFEIHVVTEAKKAQDCIAQYMSNQKYSVTLLQNLNGMIFFPLGR